MPKPRPLPPKLLTETGDAEAAPPAPQAAAFFVLFHVKHFTLFHVEHLALFHVEHFVLFHVEHFALFHVEHYRILLQIVPRETL